MHGHRHIGNSATGLYRVMGKKEVGLNLGVFIEWQNGLLDPNTIYGVRNIKDV